MCCWHVDFQEIWLVVEMWWVGVYARQRAYHKLKHKPEKDPEGLKPAGPSVWLSDRVWVARLWVRLEHTALGVKP